MWWEGPPRDVHVIPTPVTVLPYKAKGRVKDLGTGDDLGFLGGTKALKGSLEEGGRVREGDGMTETEVGGMQGQELRNLGSF